MTRRSADKDTTDIPAFQPSTVRQHHAWKCSRTSECALKFALARSAVIGQRSTVTSMVCHDPDRPFCGMLKRNQSMETPYPRQAFLRITLRAYASDAFRFHVLRIPLTRYLPSASLTLAKPFSFLQRPSPYEPRRLWISLIPEPIAWTRSQQVR